MLNSITVHVSRGNAIVLVDKSVVVSRLPMDAGAPTRRPASIFYNGIGIVEFNVPRDTVYVISETGGGRL